MWTSYDVYLTCRNYFAYLSVLSKLLFKQGGRGRGTSEVNVFAHVEVNDIFSVNAEVFFSK